MVMTRDQYAGKNLKIKIDIMSFEKLVQFQYVEQPNKSELHSRRN